MRVCYLSADRGISLGGHKGAAAHVRGFIGALRDDGHDVVVVTPDPGDVDLGVRVIPVSAPLVVRDADLAMPAGRALAHVWNNVAVEHTLRTVLRQHRTELLYERYSPFGVAGGVVARHEGVFHVLEVNAPLAWEGAQYRQQALQDAAAALEERAFTLPSLIVTVSEDLKRQLVVGGVPASRLDVVPNGVDAEMFTPDGPCRRVADDDAVVIGFVGGLRPWHGIDVLLDACAELASDPRFHLLVVGDGPAAKQVRASQSRLGGRLTITGAVAHHEIPELMRGIDIAVAPYSNLDRFYFSPLKVLEYMAAGRAIVAAGIGQLTELIRHEQNGLLVPPGDAPALAEAIRRLGGDPALRRRLGSRAACDARREHTWRHRVATVLQRAARAA